MLLLALCRLGARALSQIHHSSKLYPDLRFTKGWLETYAHSKSNCTCLGHAIEWSYAHKNMFTQHACFSSLEPRGPKTKQLPTMFCLVFTFPSCRTQCFCAIRSTCSFCELGPFLWLPSHLTILDDEGHQGNLKKCLTMREKGLKPAQAIVEATFEHGRNTRTHSCAQHSKLHESDKANYSMPLVCVTAEKDAASKDNISKSQA